MAASLPKPVYAAPVPGAYPAAATPCYSLATLAVRTDALTGRGVYATAPLPRGTLLATCPVVVVAAREYAAHAQHTVLKDYVFAWGKRGDQAVALGLGSLFNHAAHPNASFHVDVGQQCISYRTTQAVDAGEQLCIFYGHSAAFGAPPEGAEQVDDDGGNDNPFAHLAFGGEQPPPPRCAWTSLDQLPLQRVTAHTLAEDRPLQLMSMWGIDSTPRLATSLNAFVVQQGWSTDECKHLRRFRRVVDDHGNARLTCFFVPQTHYDLNTLVDKLKTFEFSEELLHEAQPTIVPVPSTAAVTKAQLEEWTKYWPVAFIPCLSNSSIRPRHWSSHRLDWVMQHLDETWRLAATANAQGHVGVACIVTQSWQHDEVDITDVECDSNNSKPPKVLAQEIDQRRISMNPLHHCVLKVIESIAQMDRNHLRQANTLTSDKNLLPGREPTTPTPYLLTGLTIFMSHEPCVMCSMALLHSRIETLYYIKPMEHSGGCGSVFSVHEQEYLNHHFHVWKWCGDDARFQSDHTVHEA